MRLNTVWRQHHLSFASPVDMSGIFFTVAEEGRKPPESLLQATRGGYPHVTLVYTGKQMALQDLLGAAERAFSDWITLGSGSGKTLPRFALSAEHAYVNAFFEERTNSWRYDVLLGLAPDDTAIVERLRRNHIGKDASYSMHPPHVTSSIHYSRQAADSALATIRAQMPVIVTVTGYTLD
jgi:hypothetical protein